MKRRFAIIVAVVAAACAKGATGPTPADAKAFLDRVNQTTLKLGIEQGRAGWVQQTYITDDTETLSAHATRRVTPCASGPRQSLRRSGPSPRHDPSHGRRPRRPGPGGCHR